MENILHFDQFRGVKTRDVRRMWSSRGEIGPCKAPFHGRSANGIPFVAPCGDCMPCRRRRTRNLIGMCAAEALLHPFSWVDTLTYEDDPWPQQIPEETWLRKHIEAYEKRLQRHYQCKFKVLIVSQLGTEKGRLHHHAIHFPQNPLIGELVYEQTKIDANNVWPHGHILRDAFSVQAARYVVAYLTKPGKGTINLRKSHNIGWQYFEQWLNTPHLRNHILLTNNPGCFIVGDKTYPIPRYWKEKAESLGHTFEEIQPAKYIPWIRESGPLKSEIGRVQDKRLEAQKEREKRAPSDPTSARFDVQILKNRRDKYKSPQELVHG